MTIEPATASLLEPFSDPAFVARYADGPPRFVPGFADLHRLTGLLLAEHMPADARVLVLGAGGGLEMKALADAYPGWTFLGVDPAPEMLKLAKQTLGVHAGRAALCQGYIDDAPDELFDGAVCLLTLHFLDAAERRRTAAEIHRRLRPGAPFVVAHSSFPQQTRSLWISRYAAFALGSGADPDTVEKMRSNLERHLFMYDPQQDEAILREAGFGDVQQFYAAITWRGWICRA